MVAPASRDVGAARFYTYKDLAELWRVKEQTVRVWFMQLRRAGKGPEKDQAYLVQRHAALRVLMIRSDYARFVQEIKFKRMK